MYKSTNNSISISEKVLLFQKNGSWYDDIFKELSIEAYQYPQKKNSQDEDDAGEFYLFFIPKIKKLITKYVNYGIPFEHYFRVSLAADYKAFCNIKNRKASILQFSKSPDFYVDLLEYNIQTSFNNYSEDSKNIYNTFTQNTSPQNNSINNYIKNIPDRIKYLFQIDEMNNIEKNSIKFRIFFLALRFANFLDKYKIELITNLTGFNREWIILKFNNILKIINQKKQQLELLRYKRNNIFCKLRLLEKKLIYENDRYLKDKLETKIMKYRSRYKRINKRISVCGIEPSYLQIAHELQIPKGTVGTGLRWIKEISRKGFK